MSTRGKEMLMRDLDKMEEDEDDGHKEGGGQIFREKAFLKPKIDVTDRIL